MNLPSSDRFNTFTIPNGNSNFVFQRFKIRGGPLVSGGIVRSSSARINPVSEARVPSPDASNVVFPSPASLASACHSQRRLRPDVMSDLTDIPPLPHISCSPPAPYLTSRRLFSCLVSPQHPDASPRYPLFLLLPGVLITTCRRYDPSHSCRCASYY